MSCSERWVTRFFSLIGVPASEMMAAGFPSGQKVIMNEFFAYLNFVNIKADLRAHT